MAGRLILLSLALHGVVIASLLLKLPRQTVAGEPELIPVAFVMQSDTGGAVPEAPAPREEAEAPGGAPVAPAAPRAEAAMPAPDDPPPPAPQAEAPAPPLPPMPDPPPVQPDAAMPEPDPAAAPVPVDELPLPSPPIPATPPSRPTPALPRPPSERRPQRPAPPRMAARLPAPQASGTPVDRPASGSEGPAAASRASLASNGAAWIGKLKQWWDQNSFYPREASQTNEGGSVRLRIAIAADGQVTAVGLVQGSGSSVLDAAAVAVFRGAHLPPFPAGTPPQPAEVVITVHYRPGDGG